MSAGAVHREPPRSDAVPHPYRHLLHPLRPISRWLIRRRWHVVVHGVEHLPRTGGAILASNHIGVIDGPLLAIFAPRPVHALTKAEMFEGRAGRFLTHAGQIRLDRSQTDPRAVKECLRVLRDGGVVGIFPEGTRGDGELRRFHRGAAYLALVSGAPVVPVAMLGTRLPGGAKSSLPPKRARLDIVLGAPIAVTPQPWPRTREQVAVTSALLRDHLRGHLDASIAALGRDLPGPLPPGDTDPDPTPGVAEQGAS